MVQCYNDCPEEVYWVLEQAKVRDNRPFLLILKRQGHEIRIGSKWDGLIDLGQEMISQLFKRANLKTPHLLGLNSSWICMELY